MENLIIIKKEKDRFIVDVDSEHLFENGEVFEITGEIEKLK